MNEKKEIKINAAKGRPMLSWVGKRPLRHVTAFPAQHIETFSPVGKNSAISENAEVWKEWPAAYPHGGLLFHGDNKEVLAHLLANGFRGKVKLIYIDPPFDSGADYVRKVQLRGGAATAKIEGESYNLGEQIQYTDIWANDNYLQFMYERLQLLRELLTEDGSIYLHCDSTKNYLLRCLMDEVFGVDNCVNEIIWKRRSGSLAQSRKLGSNTDTILFYSKSSDYFFKPQYTKIDTEDYVDERFINSEPDGRKYRLSPMVSPSYSPTLIYEYKGYQPPLNGWSCSKSTMEKWDKEGKLVFPSDKSQRIQRKQFLDEWEGRPIQSLWVDIAPVNPQALDRTNYPTQKPEALSERILQMSTEPGDLILDCFIGSGTTATVAQQLGRRWIGCDINKGAIQTTAKRLQVIINNQLEETRQKDLITTEDSKPEPAQLSYGVWRVNDYDLKIQRNEAIKLACEHIGVERIASEVYFDGKLGKKLVKIIPFEHPLSPLDLEESKRELEARPEVENTIVFVCLGIELAARTWIEDWNRLRKGEHTVNKIEVIELRTDAKYGNFIKHEPATAKVSIAREGDKIKVRIEDFISPTILKRLDMDLPLFKAKITDWRSQVDCVMIDTAYNGEVFNVTLSDVPEKKNDLIDGSYSLAAPAGTTAVAVKIIDMLGEEVLITGKV